MAAYDALVVGLGAAGSAATFHLARRGLRVLGLEQFEPAHSRGSHHGESRITRRAYFEHPDYVPLLHRAFDLWRTLEAEAGVELLRLVGGLFLGPSDGALVPGSQRSALVHGIAHEVLDADEIRRRFPALRPAASDVALFEPGAGILYSERCVQAHLRLAAEAGAELRYGERVLGWSAEGDACLVRTTVGSHRTARLVLTAGAWLGPLLQSLGLSLTVERQPVLWLQPLETPQLFESDRLPVWIWETADSGVYYGVPHLDRPGAKAALHHTGVIADPNSVDRQVTPADEEVVRNFVRRHLPALDGALAGGSVCLYTNTADEHFVVDRHPEHPQVAFASACSGHGFKFSSVVGEILADLVLAGRATPHAGFLQAQRLLPAGGTSPASPAAPAWRRPAHASAAAGSPEPVPPG